MKKTRTICLILCVLAIVTAIPVPVCAEPAASTESSAASVNGCYSTDAKHALLGDGQLVENVKAAFLYEANSDTLLYAWEPDTAVDPASLVKITTALVAIENGSLNDAVTVKQAVLDTVPYDAVSAKLVADEVLSLENLLYCMIVGSANDAAAVIADHIGGTQEAFVQLMNQRVAEIGCTGTVFTNPHGLFDEQQHTTARDTAKILDVAIDNQVFTKIFGTTSCIVEKTNKSESRKLSSSNFLMTRDDMQIYYDPRVTGGRTGIASDGTRCLAATSEANGMRLISVVMGSKSVLMEDGSRVDSFGSFAETKTLLDAAFSGYKTVQVIYNGQILCQQSVTNGANDVSLGSQVSVHAVLPEGTSSSQLSFRYSHENVAFEAPIKKGDKLSTVEIWYADLCVAQVELFAMNTVKTAQSLTPVVEKKDDNGFGWLLVLILIVMLVVLTVFAVRKGWVQSILTKRRRKRRHADRRRNR